VGEELNLLTEMEMGLLNPVMTAAGGELSDAVVVAIPNWPTELLPQQRTPSVASRQVKSLPAAIMLNVFPEIFVMVGAVGIETDDGGDVEPSPSWFAALLPQHLRVLLDSKRQVWRSPAEIDAGGLLLHMRQALPPEFATSGCTPSAFERKNVLVVPSVLLAPKRSWSCSAVRLIV
jgi:hypothetical protein